MSPTYYDYEMLCLGQLYKGCMQHVLLMKRHELCVESDIFLQFLKFPSNFVQKCILYHYPESKIIQKTYLNCCYIYNFFCYI